MSDGELYHYYVSISPNPNQGTDGKKYQTTQTTDPADAMAAWSAGITAGAEYVTLEALRERREAH
jgi:hypothetical protein